MEKTEGLSNGFAKLGVTRAGGEALTLLQLTIFFGLDPLGLGQPFSGV